MDISKHICGFLSENPSVVVPGLGRFIAVDKPSVITGDTILPPVRTVEFNSSDDEDDGVFVAYIAEQECVDIEQTKAQTSEFYNNLKEKLSLKKTIMLSQLGTLSVNDLGDIIFTPDTELNIVRKDTYGLASVNLQGKETENSSSEASVKQDAETEAFVLKDTDLVLEPAINISEPADTVQDTTQEPVVPEESLFASQNVRVRENTSSRPSMERREPPVTPPHSGTNSSQQTKKKNQPDKKKKTSTASNGFPMWIVLVLVIAVGLSVGFYFAYPKISPYIDSAISSITGAKKKDKTEQIAQKTTQPEENAPDSEVAQGLDEITDKKNALNPSGDQPTQTTEQPVVRTEQPATSPQATTQTPSQPKTSQPATSVSSQNSATPRTIGQGKYLLIAGSYSTQAHAEKFGNLLQKAGINYEIIDYGGGRVRVAVGSYNDKTEAFNQISSFKSKPHCENVWVLRR